MARAALLLFLVVGCGSSPPAEPPVETSTTLPKGKIDMGGGEVRIPQPFTVEQRLLEAARQGDRVTLERAVARGASLAAKDDLGRSLVLLATLHAGDLGLVQWLRAKGAALDESDVGGRTALSFAAETGRLDIVRYLVENGADVGRRDVQQRTPLFHAALGDHVDVVAFLLDHRADPNARDQFGDTPLIAACAKGNPTTAALLLARGADPSLKDQEGRTARERSDPGATPCRRPGLP